MRVLRKLVIVFVLLATVLPAAASTVSLSQDEKAPELRWRSAVVKLTLSSSFLRESSNIKRDSDVLGALRRSIEAWSSVANIDFQVVNSDKQNVSPSGAVGDGLSLITIAQTPENVLLFAKDPENAAATTRVFYNRRGFITEADIVLNPYQQFSTDGTFGTFDLESTLTHEIGHLLGLAHSQVRGSTMHANYDRNGVYGQRSLLLRTLSADDIASVRTLYGPRGEDVECCGAIEGRIQIGERQVRTGQVWIEDTNGRVQGSVELTADGRYLFTGLTAGRYRVLVQESSKTKNAAAAQVIGEALVESGETTIVNGRAIVRTRDFEITYLGLNGQLSDAGVPLSAGRTYTIYLGGRNLDPKNIDISFSSPYLSAVPGSMRSLDYGDDVSVVSFEIRINRAAPRGEYSVFAETRSGDKRAIVGGLTIENTVDLTTGITSFEE